MKPRCTVKNVEQYYTETQGEVNWINVHVENNYYWDQYGYSGSVGIRGYNHEKTLHSYGTDGGLKGFAFSAGHHEHSALWNCSGCGRRLPLYHGQHQE